MINQNTARSAPVTSTLQSKEKENKLSLVVLSTSIGTLIEWYDLILALVLAPVLSRNLFPENDARFLETLAIVVTSYLVRPVGSLIFGSIGDSIGRKKPFLFSLLLMGGATFLIGCIPTFQTIGWFAPLLLLIFRLLQGLAISGEYTGAILYVAEHAPDHRRGFYTGLIQCTVPLGLLLCLLVLFITQRTMTSENFQSYGWRFPFLMSAVLVMLGYLVRLKLKETPRFAQLKSEGNISAMPVKESFKAKGNVKLMLVAIFGGCAAQSTIMQTTHFVMLFFLQRTVLLPLDTTLIIIGSATLLGSPFFLFFGGLSDKLGRKRIILLGLILSAVLIPVVFYLILKTGNPTALKTIHPVTSIITIKLILLIVSLHICCAMVYGPLAAFILELFPTRIRFTSMGFTYNIGNGVLGGSTTFVTELFKNVIFISAALSPFAGLIYPLSLIVIAIAVNMFLVPETYKRKL
ncbi:MAG TPA: MFS transporter [Chryseolinea sp.]